jgi:hypothetical protein
MLRRQASKKPVISEDQKKNRRGERERQIPMKEIPLVVVQARGFFLFKGWRLLMSKPLTNSKPIIKEFEIQHKVKVNYNRTPWGKEGEVDYCLSMEKLTAAQQTDFINISREFSSNRNLFISKKTAIAISDNRR